MPKHFQNYNDEQSLISIPPKLPNDLHKMDEYDRATAMEEYRPRHLHLIYLVFTRKFHETHFNALKKGTDLLQRKAFTHVGNPWEGNSLPLKADLIHITRIWSDFTKEQYGGCGPCPISCGQSDVDKIVKLQQD